MALEDIEIKLMEKIRIDIVIMPNLSNDVVVL